VIASLAFPPGPTVRFVAAFNQGLRKFVSMAVCRQANIAPATCLTGGLIDLGDRVGLLHARYRLGSGHQHGRLGGFDGASCGDGHRDRRHGLIVRDIGDDEEIVLTEAIPATNELAPDGLAGSAAHGFNAVLRLLELGG